MDLGLHGRVAIVAAASRGLGKAAAAALAAEGAHLVVAARGEESLAATVSELRAAGVDVVPVVADGTDPDVPGHLVETALDRFGRLDVVVANAGGPPPGRALDVDDAGLMSALEANLLSSIRLARHAVPPMRAAGWGRLCCVTSYTIVQAAPTLALSNTARTALWAWAKTAAQDLARQATGITVNLACPGPHATDRMRELGASGDTPMGDPAAFGRIVAFLCSEPAAFVNGARLVVDGGATLAL
ncbi:MAG: SDR family oxidoreductase [Actinomycetota bacterium]|nr:SDR family oxidoreductase [Actinomycetota bacterium]